MIRKWRYAKLQIEIKYNRIECTNVAWLWQVKYFLDQIESGIMRYGVCLKGSNPRWRKHTRWTPRSRRRFANSLSCFVFEPTTTLMTDRRRSRSARSSASRIVNSTPSASIADRTVDASTWAFVAAPDLPACCWRPAFSGICNRTGGGVPFALPPLVSPFEPLSEEAANSDVATNAVCLGALSANGSVPCANSSACLMSSTITRLLVGSKERCADWIAAIALLLPPSTPPTSPWVLRMPSRSSRSSPLIRRHFSDLSSSSGISLTPCGKWKISD